MPRQPPGCAFPPRPTRRRRALAAVLFLALLPAACGSSGGHLVRERDGVYRLDEVRFAAAAAGDRRDLYREFAVAVQRLAGEGASCVELAPLFEDFARGLASRVGPEAAAEFLADFEHSLRLLETRDIPRALAEARRRGAVGRDVLVEYRIPFMQRSLATLRAASWGLAGQIRVARDAARSPVAPPITPDGAITISHPGAGALITSRPAVLDVRGDFDFPPGPSPRLVLYVDRSAVARSQGLSDADTPAIARPVELAVEGRSFRTSRPLRLEPGTHLLTVAGIDAAGVAHHAEVRVVAESPDAIHAVLAGVNTYDDPRVPALRFCEADARSMAEHLTGNLRIPAINVRLLPSPAKAELVAALEEAVTRIGDRQDATFIFYFSGHGVPAEDLTGTSQIYLLARDSRTGDLPLSGVSDEELASVLTRIKARVVVAVIDACHSGGLTFLGDLRERWLAWRPHMLFASSSPAQPSKERDDLGHGVFTHSFLEGAAGAADLDGDHLVTGLEIFGYLQRERGFLAGQDPVLRTVTSTEPVILGVRR